jgi:hypothetical protein
MGGIVYLELAQEQSGFYSSSEKINSTKIENTIKHVPDITVDLQSG